MAHIAVSVSNTTSVTLLNWKNEPEKKHTVILAFYRLVDTRTA